MKNKSTLIIGLICCSFVVLSIGVSILLLFNRNQIQQKELDHATQTYMKAFDTIYQENKKLSKILFEGLSQKGDVLAIFRSLQGADEVKQAQLRQQLFENLQGRYKVLAQNNARQIDFYLSNNQSFLRMGRPDKYGDTIADFSHGIVHANKSSLAVDGFEVGRIGSGFHFIFPIVDTDGKHLGSAAITFGAEEFIAAIMQHYNVLCNFFISAKMVDEVVFEDDKKNFTPAHHFGYYYDKKVLAVLKQAANKEMASLIPQVKVTDAIYEIGNSKKSGTVYDPTIGVMITVIPVHKMMTKEIAGILTVRSYAQNIGTFEKYFQVAFGCIITLLLLSHILIYVLLQKYYASRKILDIEAKFRLAIEGSNQGMWDWDFQTNTVYFSPQWKEMLGYKEDEIKNSFHEWEIRVHPEDLLRAKEDIQAHCEGKTKIYENTHRVQCKDSSWIWIRSRGKVLFDDKGNAIRMLGFHEDVTLKKQYEENLEKLVAKQVEDLAKRDYLLIEQNKLASMGEMMGAIAHQWRQPLNALNINIQNLDDDYDDGLLDRNFLNTFIAKNRKIITFMSKTIDDFRNFFRIDKEKQPFDPMSAIKETLSLVEAQMSFYGISLHVSGEGCSILGYRNEFQQVILNLLSNAKDAILDNGVQEGKITIMIHGAVVVIEDNGGGVEQKILNRIFEPYFTTKEQSNGTGMGLYISKMIIEKNIGGTLSVTNVFQGAQFTIDLSTSTC